MQGSSGDQRLIRQRVCEYMLAHRASFEPFVEDDEKFDDYMRVRCSCDGCGSVPCFAATWGDRTNVRQEMAMDGSWAGQVRKQHKAANAG